MLLLSLCGLHSHFHVLPYYSVEVVLCCRRGCDKTGLNMVNETSLKVRECATKTRRTGFAIPVSVIIKSLLEH